MNDSDRSYMNDVQHSTIWHTYVLGKDKNIDLDLTISSRKYEELKKRLGIHHWFIYYPFTSHGYKYHFQIIIKNKSRIKKKTDHTRLRVCTLKTDKSNLWEE